VFQCVIAISDKETFVMFHYVDGLFETVDEILDGNTTIQAGLSAGDRRHFVTIPGSGTEDIVSISNTSNVDIPGVWIFQTNEKPVKHPGEYILWISVMNCLTGLLVGQFYIEEVN